MHIGIVLDSILPATKYGGTERVAVWLGQELLRLGHKVTFICRAGSALDFAPVVVFDRTKPLEAQIPKGIDIVHSHCGLPLDFPLPACQTIHGNDYSARVLHPNTIFVSKDHAARHGGSVWIHHGMDPSSYGVPDFHVRRERLAFLAKAAWSVKNVRGAIKLSRACKIPLDVLGGKRFNFKMGLRLTFDPRVRFHGLVDDAVKSRVLRLARGLLFPVRWNEPFGIAVIEAMYFGVPVFGTPYGSLPELVAPHVGCLSADADELRDAIQDERRFDSREIHDHWKKNFTTAQMASRHLECFERILAGESLQPAAIHAPPTRDRELLPWKNAR